MNLNVSSTDSADENLVSTERNSGSSSISFSDDEKPSQALTKIQSDEEKIVDFSAQV